MPLLMPIKYKRALTEDEKLAIENASLRAELRQHYRSQMLQEENRRLNEQLSKIYSKI